MVTVLLLINQDGTVGEPWDSKARAILSIPRLEEHGYGGSKIESYIASEGGSTTSEIGEDIGGLKRYPVNYLQPDKLVTSYHDWYTLRVEEQAGVGSCESSL